MGVCFSLDTGEDEVDESKLHFLHGQLRVHVQRAADLPDTDTVFFNIDGKDVTDPYVTASLGQARLFCSKYIANDLNPTWDEVFRVPVCHHANEVKIDVKDKEHVGNQHIASCSVPVETIIGGEEVEDWFELTNGDKGQGKIYLSIK